MRKTKTNRTDVPVPSGSRWRDWKWQMKNRLRSPAQLASLPGTGEVDAWATLLGTYPMAVTPYYLSLVVDPSDRSDPIGRQCLPDPGELAADQRLSPDPLQEEIHMPVEGLIHRYEDRCLALITTNCAIHCRHCNRKRYGTRPPWEINPERLAAMTDYIGARKFIREVILSGGDPLIASDEKLDWILKTLRAIKHVEVLRIGTRVPVVMPMRVTSRLCAVLKRHRPLWLNTQFNHPRELTSEAQRACEMILEAGVPVSNQSVLIKGVNDDFETMRELLHGLQRAAVRPYYLFQAEPVEGTSIYHADPAKGQEIMERLRQTTAGLCLPRYVSDQAGRKGKLPLDGPAFHSENNVITRSHRCIAPAI